MKKFCALAMLVLLGGCAGNITYSPPVQTDAQPNKMEVALPKAALWPRLVRNLSSEFFIINNLDENSGLINVSYSGDPAAYVDCGTVDSFVQNLRGKREYRFNDAASDERYETMIGGSLLLWHRETSLKGRMNIIVSEDGSHASLVAVNTRYILAIHSEAFAPNGNLVGNFSNTIDFDTGGVGHGATITCRPTGALERQVLSFAH